MVIMTSEILQNPLARGAVGLLLAVVVVAAARKTRTLSTSGAVAAVLTGTITMAAGWSWGFLLIGLFVTGTALSRFGESKKNQRVRTIVAKGGERDWIQVAANGGVFVAAALASLLFPDAKWQIAGIGALAASAADTWSTEIGTLSGVMPRLIISGRKVPAGTSGGITLSGTLGAVAGAACAGVGARLAGWTTPIMVIIVAGTAGAIADSLLGATIQTRRWCAQCGMSTERDIHVCGAQTTHAGGIAGFGNDAVNFASTLIGAMTALMLRGLGGIA